MATLPPSRTHPTAWPQPPLHLLRAFEAAHPVFKTSTQGYLSTQRQMLWLAALNHPARMLRFEAECLARKLSPTTAATYWTAFTTVLKALKQEVTQDDKKYGKLLESRAVMHPVKHAVPMTLTHVATVLHLEPLHPLTVLIVLAFVGGQRISDMLRLAAADVFPEPSGKGLLITVRRGKTVALVGRPYTIPIPATTSFGEWNLCSRLLEWRTSRTKDGHMFLWTENDEEKSRNESSAFTSRLLAMVSPDLEIRSVRRGGLIRMATMAIPLKTILLFSQHQSESMLHRYLDWGRMAIHQLDEMSAVARKMLDLQC